MTMIHYEQDLEQIKKLIEYSSNASAGSFDPFTEFSRAGSRIDQAEGRTLLAQGLMGCFVVAGGQGTRLGWRGPKGKFPVTAIRRKSLFQLVAEKTVAASRLAGRLLPLVIMTSPLNHAETVEFFEEQGLFGLKREQLAFITQPMLPLCDQEGNPLEELGPTGNGVALGLFVGSGLHEAWWRQGVRYLNFILIDNALADPFDAELLGFHLRTRAEVTVKCTPRRDAQESVGVLVNKEGKAEVVEYSELSQAERSATTKEGDLKHLCANISLFCFSMDFVKETANQPLPWHLAKKAVGNNWGWKAEKFIFDLLPHAKNVKALLYPREKCFAPLKNREGLDSPATVQALLEQQDRSLCTTLWGKVPTAPFELAPAFYYTSEVPSLPPFLNGYIEL